MRFLAASLLLCSLTAAAETVVFESVHVITLRGDEVLKEHDVVVQDGRISMVGSAPESLQADVHIPGHDLWLMPGLAEMHAHIPSSSDAQAMEDTLALYLSQGITTVRGMLGEPGHLAARDAQREGRLDAPRILAGGPSLNGNTVRSPEHGVEKVQAQHAAGYDHLKIHPGLSRAQFDAIAERARELGIRFTGHVSPAYGALHALAAGQATIDHLDGFIQALVPPDSAGARVPAQFFGINLAAYADRDGIDDLAARVNAADAWVVPTETLMVSIAGPQPTLDLLEQPGMAYVSPATRERWREAREGFIGNPAYDAEAAAEWLALRRALIAAVHRHGQRVLLGSDAPQVFNVPGFSIHRELALYVAAGLSPREALATGNVNVARYLGIERRRGRIVEGHDADLVLLRENPLADIDATRSVIGVMVGGRWYDRHWIDRRLAAIAERHAGRD